MDVCIVIGKDRVSIKRFKRCSMSLIVYDQCHLRNGEIPVPYMYNTTNYFDNTPVLLKDTQEVREIIKFIDNCDYIDEHYAQSRMEPVQAIVRTKLSSGCKAVLCTALCEGICFSQVACGPNAIYKILQLNHGITLFTGGQYPYSESLPCDILYRGNHFTDIVSFLAWRGNNGFDY